MNRIKCHFLKILPRSTKKSRNKWATMPSKVLLLQEDYGKKAKRG